MTLLFARNARYYWTLSTALASKSPETPASRDKTERARPFPGLWTSWLMLLACTLGSLLPLETWYGLGTGTTREKSSPHGGETTANDGGSLVTFYRVNLAAMSLTKLATVWMLVCNAWHLTTGRCGRHGEASALARGSGETVTTSPLPQLYVPTGETTVSTHGGDPEAAVGNGGPPSAAHLTQTSSYMPLVHSAVTTLNEQWFPCGAPSSPLWTGAVQLRSLSGSGFDDHRPATNTFPGSPVWVFHELLFLCSSAFGSSHSQPLFCLEYWSLQVIQSKTDPDLGFVVQVHEDFCE